MKVCKTCPNQSLPNRRYCLKCLNTQEKIKRIVRLEIKKRKKLEKSLKKKEKKANSYKVVSKKAWNNFAKWLKKGLDYFTCYTCGKTLPIEQAQAGHCFHRGNTRYKAIDFDPRHIKLQCGGCNCFSTGQTNVFQAKLTRELGIEEVEKMIWRRANEQPLTISELKDLIAKYSL